MKKFLSVVLSVSMLAVLFSACDSNTGGISDPTPSPSAAASASPSPSASPEASPSASPDVTKAPKAALEEEKPMTAAEAKGDKDAIQNDLDSIQELIDEELYDDAMETIKTLLTKDLTDEQKNKVMEYKQLVQAKLGQQ